MTTSPIRIINTFGPQRITDIGTQTPFSNVTINDPNAGETEALTVTLSNAANGILSNLGGGTYDPVTGVYTITGTASAVSSALDGLIFTPTYHQSAAGSTVTTTLTISDTDTANVTATDSNTIIITTETNSPKPIGVIRGVDYGPSPAAGGVYPSSSQIDADMATIATIGNTVRLYTVSNGMSYAVTSAIAHGLQVIPSAYLLNPNTQANIDANNAEINNLISLLQNLPASERASIPFVDVGSDFLTNNPTQLSYLKTEIGLVQAAAKPLGLMVASSESANTYLNTNLGSAVDLIFPTISPFADGSSGVVTANNAAAFAFLQYEQLVQTFPTQNVVISAIGWPSSGTNGSAVGSVANEELFWSNFVELANQNHINYFGFEAFDSSANTSTGFSGANWGLYTSSGAPKGVVKSFSSAPPPQIVGTVSGQQANVAQSVTPFSGVSVVDPNNGQTETLTITVSSPTAGGFGTLGPGTYNAATGVYSVTGSASTVTTAIDGLVFTPALGLSSPSGSIIVTFTIADADTAGATAIDSNTTVTYSGVPGLNLVGNEYAFAGSNGTILKLSGSPVTVGEFGTTISPVAAVKSAIRLRSLLEPGWRPIHRLEYRWQWQLHWRRDGDSFRRQLCAGGCRTHLRL
jgi:exo-beta-1,3-glucanase (GH17 family)